MNQFKDVFLGTGDRPYTRAVDTQKCIRAGGKHNDLDDVGKDTYHHTFFEMLGNWSFGDYFKAQAIDWAWELLTSKEHWGLDPSRLYATYFEGDESEGLEPDHEARDLWLKHLPADHVLPGNKKDNFWEMGDTGPCGPCSELHYDGRPPEIISASPAKPTDAIRGSSETPNASETSGRDLVNADHPDVIEIWNLVFIQYNSYYEVDGQQELKKWDVTPSAQRGELPYCSRDEVVAKWRKLRPLPAKHVDTGMGFERIVRVIQNKDSNYDTDVFTPIFAAIQNVTGARPYSAGGSGENLTDPINIAYRVIADHIRTLTFALTDGAHCGNDGRNYVLRLILRRAVRYGRQTLGVQEPFFYKLVPTVVENFKGPFPEIVAAADAVMADIKDEEESFGKTLNRGISLFEDYSEMAKWIAEGIYTAEEPPPNPMPARWIHPREVVIYKAAGEMVIPGGAAFRLHDTYGFPIQLTQLMAEERGMTVDVEGFNRLMEEARELSRAGGNCGADSRQSLVEMVQQNDLPATEFTGYGQAEAAGVTTSMHVFRVGNNCGLYKLAEKVSAGRPCAVVLGQTPFYAEAGGQVGDAGVIQVSDLQGGGARLKITDTVKVGDIHFHLGEVIAGTLLSAESVTLALAVDAKRRALTQNNHTTTHVMNRALRDHVNAEANQKGSLVDDEKLRFDFSHGSALTPEQIAAVEKQVNDDIAKDMVVYAEVVPQEDALKINGLRAVFGEKYPPSVRVVSIGVPVADLIADPGHADWPNHSIEFCGGTHLAKTGDAEGFCIVSQESVSKGVRRITALTGAAAHKAVATGEQLVSRAAMLADAPADTLAAQVEKITKAADAATLPLVARSELRVGLTALSHRLKEYQKAQGNQAEQGVVAAAQKIAEAHAESSGAASGGGAVIVAEVPGADGKTLRTAMDVIRKKHGEAALFLAANAGGKVAMIASVPKALIEKGFKAGDWIKHVAPIVGGGGGGRPDMAQAGGKDPAKLPEALAAAEAFAADQLS